MELMVYLLGFLGGFAVVVAMWWNYECSEKTYREKLFILECISDTNGEAESTLKLIEDYDSVSYTQHARALFFFKDPMKLYPESIRELFYDYNNV